MVDLYEQELNQATDAEHRADILFRIARVCVEKTVDLLRADEVLAELARLKPHDVRVPELQALVYASPNGLAQIAVKKQPSCINSWDVGV